MDMALRQELRRIRQLTGTGNTGEALLWLEKLQKSPEFPLEDLWQLDELFGACYSELCDMKRAAGAYWTAFTHDRYLRSQLEHYSSYLFCLHYLPDIDDAEMRKAHLLYNRFFADVEEYTHTKVKKARLRIGYLSTDFHDHTAARFVKPLLMYRDTVRYEAICYAMDAQEDQVTCGLRRLADGWRDLSGLSFAEAAQRIYEDEVDILFDLSGHSNGGCTLIVAGYKPAPVQLSGIGWFDTTGLAAIDYFLTDRHCNIHVAEFSEQPLRLPHSHLCYMPLQDVPACGYYEPHAPFVFGSFNNFAKITDEMLTLWLSIVHSVPGAHLLLKDTGAFPARQQAIHERAMQLGYAENELELRSGSPEYLKEFDELDIMLDPYPYPGGGMTCEALLMGVPVVSLAGTRHGTRFGCSLLKNAGLDELVAEDCAGYKAIAVTLAHDKDRLCTLHRTLRSKLQASPVMDGVGYMREMEQLYEEIWTQWLRTKKV
jgi:protein O-GlcNAc transferase